MALATYKLLALKWEPSQKADKVFLLIAIVTVVSMLLVGAILSSIDVPEKSREVKAKVPERVAKFINKKPKPPKPPKPPKAKPKPKPPEPKPPEPKIEKPTVERLPPKEKKPLTKVQKDAREKVKNLGVLKHLSALSDMIDTPVGSQLKSKIQKTGDSKVTAGHDASVLTANATKGSGGVNSDKYATTAGSSDLGEADLSAAKAALAASEAVFSNDDSKTGSKGSKTRSEEEIILVIDRHKSQLQGIYNRARRKNPSLKGMLVLEITILANGSVSAVNVVSSELNDPKLERSMAARIKKLQFEVKDVDTVTVKYPIEFLPY